MASELNLNMRSDGFVKVEDLLKLNLKTFATFALRSHTVDDVREAVRRDNKQRFSLMEENRELWIRANQGHTITGHSATTKNSSDGRVDSLQILHNLNEDELSGFEENWKSNADKHLPGRSSGFNQLENAGANLIGWDGFPSWREKKKTEVKRLGRFMSSKSLIASLKNLLDECERYENLIKQIHARSTTLGLFIRTQKHQHFACKLLNIYAKLNKPLEAHKVFAQIPDPDIVSWTSLFNLYLKIQQPNKALSLFSHLLFSASLKPDAHSILAALSACARTQDLNAGRSVHGMVYRLLCETEAIVNNAVIDMYSRSGQVHLAKRLFDNMQCRDVSTWTSLLNGFIVCGNTEAARQVFDDMPQRNVVSWTAMIVGYVRVKNPIEALELFIRMMGEGRDSPTLITIVAVLSGCADAGALDFGRSIHGYVNKIAGFNMNAAVNNGLIDMYAKSGNLDSAENVFVRMVNKDLFSWTSIISGLAFHGRGKHALEHFDKMVASGMIPNEITFLSVLSACNHAGLVGEGQNLFKRLRSSRFEPTMEHYGCMVDLLGRAGFLEEAVGLIEDMPFKPDTVIWRSLLSACLGHNNLDLAEMAGKKVLELEPDDDGVCVLLWNLYRSKKMWEDASRMGKMMRDQRIKKKPGSSWVEVNGVVREFLAETSLHPIHDDIYIVLEGIAIQSKPNIDIDVYK